MLFGDKSYETHQNPLLNLNIKGVLKRRLGLIHGAPRLQIPLSQV